MKIERLEDIEAWQLARQLTQKVYRMTRKPRFARDHGLKGQIQSAAGSSMHNIAEGFDSETNADSFGSCATPSGLAQKSRANFMLPWMKNTYLPTNSKTFMSRPDKRVLLSVDSSNISRNTKSTNHSTLNLEH